MHIFSKMEIHEISLFDHTCPPSNPYVELSTEYLKVTLCVDKTFVVIK